MPYPFEKPGSPFWWMGFVNEAGVQDQESTKILVGTKPREKRDSKMQATARALARQQEAEDARAGKAPDLITGVTFAQLAERYMAEHAAALRSAASTGSRLKHLVAHFGPKLITSILTGDVRAFLTKMQTTATPEVEGVSRSGVVLKKSSVEHLRRLLRAMFNFARDAHLVRSNPVTKELAIKQGKAAVRYLAIEQVAKILLYAPQEWRAFLAVALYLGLRKGEVIGLRCKSVDMARGIVTVAHSYDGPTKGDQERVVPIPPELVPFLKAELGRARSEYLFPSKAGKMMTPYRKTEKIIRRAAIAAGLVVGFDHICRRKSCTAKVKVERRADAAPSECEACGMKLWVKAIPIDIQFKDTRSTWATHTYEATGDETFVQDALGHQDLSTTGLYNAKRIAHAVKQGAKISYNLLAMAETQPAEVASVVRIPSTDRGVAKCAILDSNQWPLAPEPKGPMLHGAAPSGLALRLRALSPLPLSHPAAPGRPELHPVSSNPLAKPSPVAARLAALRLRFA